MTDYFKTTQWTQIVSAKDPNDPGQRRAMNELCRRYEAPLRAYARYYSRVDEEGAGDIVQSFFLSLLEHGGVTAVDRERGRFRTWLKACLKNHIHVLHERRIALKRDDRGNISLDDDAPGSRASQPVTDYGAPDRIFDKRWALTVLSTALAALHTSKLALSSPERYRRVRNLVVGPEGDDPTYAPIAAALGESVGSIKTYVSRLRELLGELIRAEIAQQVQRRSDIDDEVRFLLDALAVRDDALEPMS